MERVCPFLALAGDARTVVDGYDAEHRCHAEQPAEAVDRQRQLGLCLTEAHRDCEAYLAAAKRHAATLAAPPPAADALLARTRLVLEAGPVSGRLAPFRGDRVRRYGLAGVIAAVGIGAVLTGTAGGLANLAPERSPRAFGAPADGPSTPPTGSRLATPSPMSSSEPSGETDPTPPPVQPTPTPPAATAVPTPAATPGTQTYVVQSGDTLSAIATRFGVTVDALMAANGLQSPDVISVGQRLVIP